MPGPTRLPPAPDDETLRLAALERYHILDTPPQEDLDRLARLAARLFKVPIALISLAAEDRQYFKSGVGIGVDEIPRHASISAALSDWFDASAVIAVPDAQCDPRLADNPLVAAGPRLRFYAAAPLVSSDGHRLGVFCIADYRPNPGFSELDSRMLHDLAALALDRMELRRLVLAGRGGWPHLQRMAATASDAIVCWDDQCRITFWNPAATRIFGAQGDDMSGRHCEALFGRHVYRRVREHLEQNAATPAVGSAAPRTLLVQGARSDGRRFPMEMWLTAWQEADVGAHGAIVRDLTEHKRSEERLFRLARVDPLTGLCDRETFNSSLATHFAARVPFALLLLDLDRFKQVNESLGRQAGDSVLKVVAQRLRIVHSRARLIARLGGDEFAVVLDESDFAVLRADCRRLLQAIADPMEIENTRVEIGASVGVAVYPLHGSEHTLLANADLALYEAKRRGVNAYRFFVADLREAAMQRKKMEAELRSAYLQGQFEVRFQPQVDVRTGDAVGAEALLRWHHPVRGLLEPGAFMTILETSPSVARVGAWIMAKACEYAASWRREGKRDFRVSVNLFPAQVHSGHLAELVDEALTASGLAPDGLVLEITENTLLKPNADLDRALRQLVERGVSIAFDDYGTGYASLSLLKRVPISRLKIDRSFVANLPQDAENAAVVQAILYLARQFQLQVVAEGVETRAQEEFLRDRGCDYAQGYLYGKALPGSEFRAQYISPGQARP